jgi:ankyrin repeat protein
MNEAPSKETIVAFFRAAETGDAQKLRDQLALHPALADCREPVNGATALILAARNGNRDAVQVLIEAGADLRAEWGCMTALSHAAYNGYSDSCYVLIQAGADPNEGTMKATACAVAGDFPSLAGALEDAARRHRESVRDAWRDVAEAPIDTARPVTVMKKLSLRPKI